MNVPDFIKKKKEEQYSFEITSPDGTHISKTSNLQEFADGWVNGNLQEGRMVTNFGDVIYPADKKTENAVKEYVSIKHSLSNFEVRENSEDILRISTGMEYRDIAKLLYLRDSNSSEKFIETDKGRVFLLGSDDEHRNKFMFSDSFLEKLNMPKGSMSLKDTIVLDDKLNDITLVVDERKEAVELVDMVSRSLEMNRVISANENITLESEGYNRGGIYGIWHEDKALVNISISGNDQTLKTIYTEATNLESYDEDNYESIRIYQAGFSNSETNPIRIELLNNVISQTKVGNDIGMTISNSDPQERQKNYFDAIEVTKDMVRAVGSKTKSFFIEKDDSVIEVKVGDLLRNTYSIEPYSKNKTEVIKKEDISKLNLVRVKNSQRNKIMPF
jgi:hypothetical protein